MKKSISVFAIVLGISVISCFLFLIYKIWAVFGFWTTLWTGLVTGVSNIMLGHLIGSRTESNGKITYNPKEWPKFINIALSGTLGYYLYTIISKPTVSRSDYYFGLSYLALTTASTLLFQVYKLIRDRNDFVEIEGNSISYKDNEKTGTFNISDVKSLEGGGDLTLHFKDGTSHKIELSEMNFNAADMVSLLSEINSRVPESQEVEQPSA